MAHFLRFFKSFFEIYKSYKLSHRSEPKISTDSADFSVGGRSEVAADDGVPSGVVLLVELLLDECRDVLLDVVPTDRDPELSTCRRSLAHEHRALNYTCACNLLGSA